MKKRSLIAPLTFASAFSGLLMMTQATQALPLADIHLKAYHWQTEYSGEIGQGENTASFDDLGFEDEDTSSFSLTLRHSIPVIPNVKIQQTTLDTENSGTLTETFEFEDLSFSASEDVTTNLDLSHFDVTAFYSLFYLDIGITGRNFDTESSIVGSTSGSATATLDGWLPMFYLGVHADLPFTGLYVDANLNTVSYDGNGLQDLSAALGYKLGNIFPLTAEAGYRKMSLELEDLDGIEGDFTIDGWFLSLGLDF